MVTCKEQPGAHGCDKCTVDAACRLQQCGEPCTRKPVWHGVATDSEPWRLQICWAVHSVQS